ncbi:hypothetical protein OKA04_12405 [Luteolibacter flavescens]|uniref:Uncharacterized protein n=1 Tax=Luteolibacter flavescens TaxID=1859460 RepID=A0ABT3FPN1_9BACT|nr:hypothetical protein [Luteolibacter flavescens]MCW1885533.1 hypothetical protein [Luteolibacter flavescens]
MEDIEIYGDSIQLAGRRLSSTEREEFAVADGFETWEDMAGWFRETHGFPFEGMLICWGDPAANESRRRNSLLS